MNSSAFDGVASTYDKTFEHNPVARHIRSLILHRMLRHFRYGDRVLDLNCGTGTDAIFLARRGIIVTAIDTSPRMVEITRRKSIEAGISDMVDARVGSYSDVDLEARIYDGAISNFGGLNCTPDLESPAERAFAALKPGGLFLACVMNKLCLWELLSFIARGRFRTALRRFGKGGKLVCVGGMSIATWYYSPRRFIRRISPWFDTECVYGINMFSPSPNSKAFIARHPTLTARLLDLERYIRNAYPFNALGDHFIVEARRRG